MEECVNDEVDDEKKRNLIEVNDTKINDEDEDEDEDCTEVNYLEENITTYTESSTSETIDDKQKGEKDVIAEGNHEVCEGKRINYERDDEDVASVEEAETMSNIVSLYKNNDSVSVFDASTCSGDNFYENFENEEEIITEDSIFWINTNKQIWRGKSH